MIRATAAQTCLDVADPAGTRERVLAVVEAQADPADLLVLPELASSGYLFGDRTELARLSEPLDGPFVTALAEQSATAGCVIVSGLAERNGDLLHNSAIVLAEGELVGVHRKVHLWGTESQVFDPGTAPAPVLETAAGRIAPLICYDLEFPELVQAAALAGAQIVTAPVNWPAYQQPPLGERPLDVVRAQAMAGMYRLFVVVADRCGVERGQDWVGGSVIIGPDGYPLAGPASGPRELVLTAELDPALADDKKLGEHNHVFDDRRHAVYRGGVGDSW